MKSCDLSLISEKIRGIDYNEAVLCAGLNNTVNIMKYGGSNLYILQGRGICFIDELLDRLQINYSLLDINELFQNDIDISCLLVVLPYIDFSKIKDINPGIVQFFHTYGTYSVDKIEGDKIILKGDYDEGIVEKSIGKSDLVKLQGLSIKPLGISYKIIYIINDYVEKDIVRKCIGSNLNKLIVSDNFKDEIGGWCKGTDFYSYVKKLLIHNWNQDFNKIAKYVFVQSIQNGSSFFYRREYSEALLMKYNNSKTDLLIAGNLWRKLSRYLKSAIIEEKEADSDLIEQLIGTLERIELRLFIQLAKEKTYAL